jgi:hypothetical protein
MAAGIPFEWKCCQNYEKRPLTWSFKQYGAAVRDIGRESYGKYQNKTKYFMDIIKVSEKIEN